MRRSGSRLVLAALVALHLAALAAPFLALGMGCFLSARIYVLS